MKTIAIVGAGPAGLVAAKTLLHYAGPEKFEVTIFEAAERVGGMWKGLPDFPWASVDLSDPTTGLKAPTSLPIFPKAWQVGRYLESYAHRFLPTKIIRLNSRVVAAEIQDDGQSQTWAITISNSKSQQTTAAYFDYLIVASGFFGQAVSNVRHAEAVSAETLPLLQHSSEFRDVASFSGKAGKIVVVGGGISGSEAAATAAFQISSARHSPLKEKPAWAESVVYHVSTRPFYCLPRFLPWSPDQPTSEGPNLSPHFLPLDLVLYDLCRRGKGQIAATIGPVPAEKARKGHDFIQRAIGGVQRENVRSETVSKPDVEQYPAFTGIADMYTEFVRSGLIIPIRGRVESVTSEPSVNISSRNSWLDVDRDPLISIDKVTGLIEATGYQPHVDYLADHVKRDLDYDPDCYRVPFLLSRGSIFSPKIPNIAFVGFYEGPYWEVMELQARMVAQAWDPMAVDRSEAPAPDVHESLEARQAVKARAPNLPQFWMSDYIGLIEELSRDVGVRRDDSAFGGQTGPAISARYRSQASSAEASIVIHEVADLMQQSANTSKFVAAATFRGMQGRWKLHRKISSHHTSLPSGTFTGMAQLHPRTPTAPTFAAEYLYVEEGHLTMNNGLSFPATRRYIYRYDENVDVITAWFVGEDNLSVTSLFNTWDFYASDDPNHGWLARGSHWCNPDTYKNLCEFRFSGATLERFRITYTVSGPRKDYSHESGSSRE